MKAGYKASHLLSSFEAQLRLYASKIERAETDLQAMIFRDTQQSETKERTMRKRVYIVYTGGTIGMIPTSDGYVPAPGYLAEQIAAMPELKSELMPEVEIHEYDTLLDSSNMTPADWHKIASDIAAHDQYDGFIVLHGTDTMAYTASALPFMLHGLRKPVIVTGSQIPLCQIRNDARANLITAMLIAANFPIPEVCLYFGQRAAARLSRGQSQRQRLRGVCFAEPAAAW